MSKESFTYLTHEKHYQAILRGEKKFEYRRINREINVGDTLELVETKDGTEEDTGNIMLVKVTHILHGGEYEIPEGFMIMSIDPLFLKNI